jgi:Lhr-like helicase
MPTYKRQKMIKQLLHILIKTSESFYFYKSMQRRSMLIML